MRCSWIVACLGCLVGATVCGTAQAVPVTIDFSTTGVPGRLYVPPEALEPGAGRPLILSLHGAGNIGTGNTSRILASPELLSRAIQRGAFVYAPRSNGSWNTTTIMAMIDQAISDWNIDPNRLYVTGLSFGGGGTWDMLNAFPDRFAAGVPIAGIDPSGPLNAANLIDVPIWVFHARNDGVVSAVSSRVAVNTILVAAGEPPITFPNLADRETTVKFESDRLPLRYTEWPLGGHGIWPGVYTAHELHDWMFAQRLVVPEPSTVSLAIMLVLCTAITARVRRGE